MVMLWEMFQMHYECMLYICKLIDSISYIIYCYNYYHYLFKFQLQSQFDKWFHKLISVSLCALFVFMEKKCNWSASTTQEPAKSSFFPRHCINLKYFQCLVVVVVVSVIIYALFLPICLSFLKCFAVCFIYGAYI